MRHPPTIVCAQYMIPFLLLRVLCRYDGEIDSGCQLPGIYSLDESFVIGRCRICMIAMYDDVGLALAGDVNFVYLKQGSSKGGDAVERSVMVSRKMDR